MNVTLELFLNIHQLKWAKEQRKGSFLSDTINRVHQLQPGKNSIN